MKLPEKINIEEPKLSALVPNEKGLERAKTAGFKEVAVFTATSEEFNKHNINRFCYITICT